MERVSLHNKKNRVLRAVFSVAFAFVLIFALTVMASASDYSSPLDAEFGGNFYETLPEAIEAANTAGGGTVTLLRDVYLSQSLTISSDVTLTGEHTVYRNDDYKLGLFVINSGCTLTLDGGIVFDGGNEWVMDYDQFLTDIQQGSPYTGTSYVTAEAGAPVATTYMFNISGNVVMNRATVQNNYGSSSASCPFYLGANATLTMNSGAVANHNYTTGTNALVACKSLGAVWTINEGVEIYDHASSGGGGVAYIEKGHVQMNGGDIHHCYGLGKDGSVFRLYGGGSFTMNGGSIHDNYAYISADQWGGTISVHHSFDSTIPKYSTFTMNGGLIGPNYGNFQTTLVGNGYNKPMIILNGGKIINVDGYSGEPGIYYYYSPDTGIMESAIIEGGTIKVRRDLVNHGTINADVILYNKADANLIGEGGNINGDLIIDTETAGKKIIISSITVNGNLVLNEKATVVINGGSYNGKLQLADGASLTIVGGSFDFDPSEWLADYCEVFYDEASGLYTVEKYYEASFGGTNYDSLEQAVAAAITAGGGRVTLLHDVDLDASIAVSADVEIFGEYTIFRSKSYTGNLFTVSEGVTLTLDGGVVVDGNNEWVLDYEGLYNCMMANGEGIKNFTTPEEGAPIASAAMFKIYGNLVMNSSTVQNNYTNLSNQGCPFLVYSGGVFTMNSGAKAAHNATTTNSSVVYVENGGTWIINDGADISDNYADANGGISYSRGQITMNGGEAHHNYLAGGAGSFVIVVNTGRLVMNGGSVYENIDVVSAGSVASVIYVHDNAKFTMNGGLIEKNYSNGATTLYAKSATSSIELNAGIIRQERRATAPTGYTTLCNGPTIIGESMLIEGGVVRFSKAGFTMDGTINGDVQIRKFSADISINGTINGNVSVDGSINPTISGGTWLGEFTVTAGSTLVITGGEYKCDPSEWLDDSFGAIYNTESRMYSVIETAKASVNGVEYTSIADAIAAANSGDTVLIIASHRIKSGIVIDKDIIIDTNNQSISASSEVAVAFTVLANATITGNGSFNTDNGHTDVFLIGSESTEGSLVISNGRFVGEKSVASLVNGALVIDGGEFAINPDGETPDYSTLINVSETSPNGARREVGVRGGSFHHFNPAEANIGEGGEITVDPAYDSVEKVEDVFSVITHSFTNYVSNMDATCDHDGTMTAKCDNCDETHTVVDEGSAGHSFSVYISDQNSTCQSKGTKTAKCDRCDATDTQEGDKYGRHQYKGVKCQNCSRGQITQLIIIAMAIGVGGFAVWFMGFDRMFRPF